MTSTHRAFAASLITVAALSGCASTPAAPLPTSSPTVAPAVPVTRVCVGPESPDDLEDLADADTVRHPDASCTPPLTSDFVFVTLTGPAPAIGEALDPDSESALAYRAVRPRTSRPAPTRAAVSPSPVSPRPSPSPAPRSAPRANTAPAPAPRVAPAPRPPAPRPAAPAPARPRTR